MNKFNECLKWQQYISRTTQPYIEEVAYLHTQDLHCFPGWRWRWWGGWRWWSLHSFWHRQWGGRVQRRLQWGERLVGRGWGFFRWVWESQVCVGGGCHVWGAGELWVPDETVHRGCTLYVCINIKLITKFCISYPFYTMLGFTEEELGSSEESGKDWDELEEEARRGLLSSVFWHCIKIKTCNFQ